jgi:hypothetical protein
MVLPIQVISKIERGALALPQTLISWERERKKNLKCKSYGVSCFCELVTAKASSKKRNKCAIGCKMKAAFLAFADSLADVDHIANGLGKSYKIEWSELRGFRDEKGIWTLRPAPPYIPKDIADRLNISGYCTSPIRG